MSSKIQLGPPGSMPVILTAKDFSEELNVSNPRIADDHFERAAYLMEAGATNNHTYTFANMPLVLLEKMVGKAFESLSKVKTIFVTSNLCAWKKEGDSVVKVSREKCKVFETNDKFSTQNIILPQTVADNYPFLKDRGYALHLHSSNFQKHPFPPTTGTDIITFFRNCVLKSCKFVDVKSLEWRYNDIHNDSKDELDGTIKQLSQKGFIVEVQEPCLSVKGDEITTFQSMSIRIPADSTIDEGATFQNHTTYKSELSVHNALVMNKGLQFHCKEAKGTAERALAQILEDLAIIADNNTLVSRYACNIIGLNNEQQQKLLKKLNNLGYTATLDTRPFMDGWTQDSIKQCVYINLPTGNSSEVSGESESKSAMK